MGLEVHGEKNLASDEEEKDAKKTEEGHIDVDQFFDDDSRDVDLDKMKRFNSEAKRILKKTETVRLEFVGYF